MCIVLSLRELSLPHQSAKISTLSSFAKSVKLGQLDYYVFFTGVYSVQDLPSLLLSLVLISFSKHHNNNVQVQYKILSATYV